MLHVEKTPGKPKAQEPKPKKVKKVMEETDAVKKDAKAAKQPQEQDQNLKEAPKQVPQEGRDGSQGFKQLAKSIVTETAAAVRDAIREELGREKKPLNEPGLLLRNLN